MEKIMNNDNLIKFLSDDSDEKFFLSEDEEKELLESIPSYPENKLEELLK